MKLAFALIALLLVACVRVEPAPPDRVVSVSSAPTGTTDVVTFTLSDDPDTAFANDVRRAYLAYWQAHDAYLAAENEVSAASERARKAGLVVGNNYEKCGSVNSDFRRRYFTEHNISFECLEIYRKQPH